MTGHRNEASGAVHARPLPVDQERSWAMLAHLLAFASAYVALGFIAPLGVLLVLGPRSVYVRTHAVEALNFNLSWLLYATAASVLAVVLIGIPILVILAIAYLVLVILASISAYNDRRFRYPLTIRLVT